MNDATQILDRLPPQVTNVLRQVQDGYPDTVSDTDAKDAFDHIARQLTPEEFQQAAASAYDKLTPEERAQIADYLRSHTQQLGIPVSNLPSRSTASTDPGALAHATAEVNRQEPNLIQDMFAPDGVFSSPLAKAALLGITAFAAQKLSNRF